MRATPTVLLLLGLMQAWPHAAQAVQPVGLRGIAKAGIVQVQAADPRQFAAAQARINELEEELRRLRGRIETLEYEQQQQLRQFEERLNAIERVQSAPAPVAAAEPAVTPDRPPQPTTPPRPAATAANPQHGQVLGTLPRDAILGTEASPATAAPAGASASYAAARDRLNRGDTQGAEAAFKQFVAQYPDDPQTPQAAYILGDLYLARGDWAEAAATFGRNYSTYGAKAPRAADNLLKLGIALTRGGEKDKACQAFNELARRHPDAPPAIRTATARERAATGCA